ncbi:uncharacterized mitochondrial protein AtMg00300-like [Impatiens glandulifera]|uniref:uncharacterized mitochondrial protein AtMg00300-like n=1 Tax=Impatiens glandulifera TaxID=253017 RepID=UPI001FB188D0|nr:uncharacterized mitochondrial protein AtMg00300-like [Impatiens glandulifera]
MRGVQLKCLYIFQCNTFVRDMVVVAEPRDVSPTSLCHKRLGHMSERDLNELNKRGYFGKHKLNDLEFCENCIYGKVMRVKFRRSVEVTLETLNYVHSDLWGPKRTINLGGGQYFFTFINDCSRKICLYILKHKDETFSKFK